MAYVDGFVLVVPTKNLKAYAKMAKVAGKAWMKYGALAYNECTGDDLNVKMGLPFPKLVKLKRGETALFSWIVYKSRADRDRILKKIMKDQDIMEACEPGSKEMPFDIRRMSYGGFKTLVSF